MPCGRWPHGQSVRRVRRFIRRKTVNFELRTLNFEWRNALTHAIVFLNGKTDGQRQCVPAFDVRSVKFDVGMRFSEVY
jgi:hypothetical protein